MEEKWNRLAEITAEVMDIIRVTAVLGWDQQTYMPAGGAGARAEQRATLERLAHERMAHDEIGELLSELEERVDHASVDVERAALLRELRRWYDQAVKVPGDLVAEMARVTSSAMGAWVSARQEGDFESFRPHLERIVELTRDKADALGYEDSPYDALLDQFEPGVSRADVSRLFADLRSQLVPLIRDIAGKLDHVDDSILRQPLDAEAQLRFANHVIKQIGFDFQRGRMDLSEHPFTTAFSPGDVRLTTRIAPNDLRPGLYAAIHEAGHGMYEQGIPKRFDRTYIGLVPSLGFHESQSRLWENIVGRSQAFWLYFLPLLRETFPRAFDTADVEMLYRAANRVEPTFIRTEADEVTYNLHVMLRYELEQALVEGNLAVADLPAAWDAKMEEYLGVRPPSVTEGVLQDVHWAHGMIGYFPTYSLGTVLSVQLYDAALEDHPQIVDEMAEGQFGTLRNWMQEKVYAHGFTYTPKDLLHRITGTEIEAGPYLKYIQEKYRMIYDL